MHRVLKTVDLSLSEAVLLSSAARRPASAIGLGTRSKPKLDIALKLRVFLEEPKSRGVNRGLLDLTN